MDDAAFKKLADHGGIWRVDGIGEILDRGRLGAATTVYFSEIHDIHIEDAYKKHARTSNTLPLLVNSASLYKFKVGSVWKEGKLVYSPPLHDYPLRIDVSRCRFHRLGKPAKLNDRWADSVIPEIQFRFGDNRTLLAESLYAVVPVLGDIHTQWLVVPCSEILRFYFGVSSRLLSSVLRGTTNDYVSWEDSRFENNTYILREKQRLSRKEAAVLTRTLTSDAASEAMFGVHKYLSSISVGNKSLSEPKPLPIRSRFPFNDETTLIVKGKRMEMLKPAHGKAYGEWGVFAMEIFHCSHSFGFTEPPIIESDEPYQNAGGQPPSSPAGPSEYPYLQEEDDLEEKDTRPNAKLKKLVILDFTNQFGGLEKVRFKHLRPDGIKNTNNGPKTAVNVDGISLGEKSYADESKTTLGIGLFRSEVESIDRDITLFVKMLDVIAQQIKSPPIEGELRTRVLVNQLSVGNHVVTMFPSNLGKRRSWHKIDTGDGGDRPRQVVIAEIKIKNRFFYFLEMELKPGEGGQCTLILYSTNTSFIEKKDFLSLLRLTAINNRWIHKKTEYKSSKDTEIAKEFFLKFRTLSVNHPRVGRKQINGVLPKLDSEKWAELLLQKMYDSKS